MKDFFTRHVLHNFGIKLLSLALSVGLWLAVSSDPPATPLTTANVVMSPSFAPYTRSRM